MSNTVSVACKMPGGLSLRVYDFVESYEPVLGGGTRKIRRAQRRQIPDVVLKGFSWPTNISLPAHIKHGFGLTSGIDADFFAAWLEQNATADIVKNGLVFAAAKAESVESQIKEHQDVRSGLEPLDPGVTFREGAAIPKDTRWPKKIEKGDRGMTV